MRAALLSQLLWAAVLHLLQCSQISSSAQNPSNCKIPPKLEKSCSCEQSSAGFSITCLGLNSTSGLGHLEPDIAKNVIELDISGGCLPCLELSDLSALRMLEVMRVTHSQVRDALCRKRKDTKLPHLVTIDLSHNYLVRVDESLTALHKLQNINLSNNHITHIQPSFSAFKQLKSLDISNNKLSNMNEQVLKDLKPSLQHVDISGMTRQM